MKRRWVGAGAALLMLGAVLCGVRVLHVEDEDMSPTLVRGDTVLVDRLVYQTRLPYRGDVVVLRRGAGELVRRVIGISGDTVEVRGTRIFIGGAEVPEPYRLADARRGGTVQSGLWRVPGGEVFVLADQREVDTDSRTFGCVPVRDLGGRVMFRCWPPRRRGWL